MSRLISVVVAGVFGTTLATAGAAHLAPRWTAAERETLRSLSLASLEPLRVDPSNRYGDDARAAELGRALFFDTRLSGNGKVSCATCHAPAQDFQDAKPLASGVGTTSRRTMPIAGTAHSPWQFWDGRADSQWGQALGPLESAVEHGGTRTQYAQVVAEHHQADYEAVFGAMPALNGLPRQAGPVADTSWRGTWERIPSARRDDITRVYANIGKAIAAYERRITLSPSRFDRYVDAELAGRAHTTESALSSDEEAGLKLFIGKGNCVNCHNGARLTDDHFHNTGVPAASGVAAVDSGRAVGVRQALSGEFNCTSRYSDAKPEDCDELRFAVASGPELVRAYKTPSLRNVAERAPYMHAGQIATLEQVLAHYAAAPSAPFGLSELKPLRLSPAERRQIIDFLRTLNHRRLHRRATWRHRRPTPDREPIMSFATRHRDDPMPELSSLVGLSVSQEPNASLMASLQSRGVDDIAQRFADGHRAYVARLNGEPAAWGWVATRAARIGELDATFTIADGERYLWNFVTLPSHRGMGVYPRLLQAIVRAESREAERFWIAYAPENHASGSGIAKAGFHAMAEMSFDANGRPAVRALEVGGAATASRVLGIRETTETLTPCWRCVRAGRPGMSCAPGSCMCDYQRPLSACAN